MNREYMKRNNVSDAEDSLWNGQFVDDDDFFSSSHYRTASRATRIGLGDLVLNGTLVCIAMAAYALFFHIF